MAQCLAHGARRARTSNPPSDFAVGGHLAPPDRQRCPKHTPLKVGQCRPVNRQVKGCAAALDILGDLPASLRRRLGRPLDSSGNPPPQTRQESRLGDPELYPRQPLGSHGHIHLAQAWSRNRVKVADWLERSPQSRLGLSDSALLRASKALDALKPENRDEEVGIDIVRNALMQPARMLAKNSGQDDGWVIKEILKSESPTFGFNAGTLKFEDMVKAGVLDPVKVTRTALQNAASAASMILTTECLVTDLPEKKDDAGAAGMGGMGGMGMGM